jgi:hypothetical protein
MCVNFRSGATQAEFYMTLKICVTYLWKADHISVEMWLMKAVSRTVPSTIKGKMQPRTGHEEQEGE